MAVALATVAVGRDVVEGEFSGGGGVCVCALNFFVIGTVWAERCKSVCTFDYFFLPKLCLMSCLHALFSKQVKGIFVLGHQPVDCCGPGARVFLPLIPSVLESHQIILEHVRGARKRIRVGTYLLASPCLLAFGGIDVDARCIMHL